MSLGISAAAWAGIGAVGSIGVGLYGASQAGDAADAQVGAVRDANQLQDKQFQQTREDYKPYREAGYSALNRLSDLLGLSSNTGATGYGSLTKPISVGDVTSDPGYQFGLDQGLKAVQGSAAARGALNSGATLKALTRYGNDYATTKYGDAYNRVKSERDTLYNRYAGIADTAQTATGSVAQAGQNYVNNASANLIGAGNARASGYLSQANAFGGGLNQGMAALGRIPYTVGPGSSANTDPSSLYAQNGSDVGWYPSDIRLKTNIERVGTSPRGYSWYRWDWIDGSGSAVGVIAQEVALQDPSAVQAGSAGFLTVDYRKV